MKLNEAASAHFAGSRVQCHHDTWPSDTWAEFGVEFSSIKLGVMNHSAWDEHYTFRLAPRTVLCNGVEVPAPESVAPKDGVDYYFQTPHGVEIVSRELWRGCNFDLRLLERGLVYLNKEDAIARAKAMLITKGV